MTGAGKAKRGRIARLVRFMLRPANAVTALVILALVGAQAFFYIFNFGKDFGHEFLAGETWHNAHDEHHIDEIQGGED